MLYGQNVSSKRYGNGLMKAEMELVPTISLVRIQNCSATNLCILSRSFDCQTPCQNMFVHVHAYVGVQLREATSLSC